MRRRGANIKTAAAAAKHGKSKTGSGVKEAAIEVSSIVKMLGIAERNISMAKAIMKKKHRNGGSGSANRSENVA
jgi:hypothetical protein